MFIEILSDGIRFEHSRKIFRTLRSFFGMFLVGRMNIVTSELRIPNF